MGGANGKMASLEVKEKKQHRRNLSDPHSATSEVGVYQEVRESGWSFNANTFNLYIIFILCFFCSNH